MKGAGYLYFAPNGEVSLLDKDMWLYVREPAFKEFFGDWEAAMLVTQARVAWSNKSVRSKFSFAPSDKLGEKFTALLGKNIKYVTKNNSRRKPTVSIVGKTAK